MKLGILGAGNIAAMMAKTILEMNQAEMGDIERYAVASRSLEKAKAFAAKHGFQKAFGSYEEMLEDPELDLVYVATPHSHHFDHTKQCVLHGKAALVEKAFTANAGQAKELLTLARERGVLVTEAIWTRYQPMRGIISELLSSGIVGEPRTLTANLSYVILQNERIHDPALAGGALLDVGVYTLNFAEMVFGRPDALQGVCLKNEYGIDIKNSITLTWKDGRMAVLNSGTEVLSDRKGIIYCTKGFIVVENINNPQSVTAFGMDYQPIRKITCPPQLTGYEYEVLEAARALRDGAAECPSMPHEETIHIMEEMDALRKQWGIVYPFE